MGKQTVVVHIEASLARRLREFLAGKSRGYRSVSEFAEVAMLNQLELETGNADEALERSSNRSTIAALHGTLAPSGHLSADVPPDALLVRPPAAPPLELLPAVASDAGSLSPWTNRFSPMKVAVRVLANLGVHGGWPTVEKFHAVAAGKARQLGFLLSARGGSDVRLAIGYPIGADAEKSVARFINSFTFTKRDGGLTGPLATLHLVNIVNGQVGLTHEGWRLAAAPSPILDESEGDTLSAPEAKILRDAIRWAPSELKSVREFLHIVRDAQGSQAAADAALGRVRSEWSRDMVVAHRAAQIGRLAELRVVASTGRGLSATIKLRPEASELLSEGVASPVHVEQLSP